jgi:hypothetical protein
LILHMVVLVLEALVDPDFATMLRLCPRRSTQCSTVLHLIAPWERVLGCCVRDVLRLYLYRRAVLVGMMTPWFGSAHSLSTYPLRFFRYLLLLRPLVAVL